MLGAEDAGGGEKLGAGLGAGLAAGALGAEPDSWCWANVTELKRRTQSRQTVESRIQHLLPTIDSDRAGEALADWTVTPEERYPDCCQSA